MSDFAEPNKAMISNFQSTPLTPDEDLLKLCSIKETVPKKLSKVVRVTQAHGSMEAKNILDKFSLLEEKKKEKEEKKQIF